MSQTNDEKAPTLVKDGTDGDTFGVKNSEIELSIDSFEEVSVSSELTKDNDEAKVANGKSEAVPESKPEIEEPAEKKINGTSEAVTENFGGWGDPSPSESEQKSIKDNNEAEVTNEKSEAVPESKPEIEEPAEKKINGTSEAVTENFGGWGDPSPSESEQKSIKDNNEAEVTNEKSEAVPESKPEIEEPAEKKINGTSEAVTENFGGWGDPSPSESEQKSKSNGSRQASQDTWASGGGDWPSEGSGGGSWAENTIKTENTGSDTWGSQFGSNDRGKSGGSGGKGCFKCGEDGHMSRECPQGGGRSGSRGKGCFKCGEDGHMSRECPQGGGGSGSGGKGCFKCGEDGHMSRECPQGGGGSGSRGKGCFKCGEDGHMSRECPQGGGGSGSRGKGCFKCGEEGHMSRECPQGGGGSGSRGKGCFKCGKEGHMSRECPQGGGSRGGHHLSKSASSSGGDWGSGGGSSWGDSGGGSSWGESPAKKSCADWGFGSNETKSEPKAKTSSDDAWGSGGGLSWGDSGGGSSWGESPAKKSCADWGFGSNETKSEPKAKTSSDDAWGSSWGDSGSSLKKSGVRGTSPGTSDPVKSGGSGGKGCFKCGENGHMSRECPQGGGGSGSRGKGCHKCGKEGHMAKDCSEPSLDADGKPRPPIYKPPDLSENDESLFDTASAGENFDSYDGMPCSVSGEDVPKNPERYETFEEAFTSETILNGLKQSKIKKPTPIQKYGMRIVMAGRDLMACAQTGSGKTLAFVLPILQDLFNDKDLRSGYGEIPSKPKALIISPTRELAVQIYKEAYKYSRGSIVKVQIIYGGTSVGHQRAKLSEGAHILVGTAGRLLDFLDKNYYDFSELKYLVLDEADRMIDQGFIPDVRKMIIHPTMPCKEKRQTLMFSATFPNAVQKVAAEFLVQNYLFLTVGILGAANSDVHQTLLKVEKFSKRNKLLEILKESANNDRTMIFVESKKTADFLASFLSQSDYRATSIHGDRYQRQREEALDDLKSGKFPILVATSVASRGLDIKDVRHVINYDLPKEIDDYIHRIGRTGRVGNKGKATSFYDPDADKALAAKLVEVIESAQQPVPDWLKEETSEGGFGNGIAFGGIDYRGESGTQEYQDLDAPKQSSNFDLEW